MFRIQALERWAMASGEDVAVSEATVDPTAAGSWRRTAGLASFVGILYFTQGVSEPTAALVKQPVQSLLESWGYGSKSVGFFFFLLSAPWWLKPLFGLCTDFVPWMGRRRKNYLIAATAAVLGGFLALSVLPLKADLVYPLFMLLLVTSLGVAFFDVVADALMVERGQPLGITGRLQSIQWAAMYAAGILMGELGGYLSERAVDRLGQGFAYCAAAAAVALAASILLIREPRASVERGDWREAARRLASACRSPIVLGVGGFLLLWNFNPFYSNVLQNHVVVQMNLGEQFFGTLMSCDSAAALVACLAYGLYSRRLRMRRMMHVSIILGIASTLAYWLLLDKRSAVLVTLAVGFTYTTAMLIQLDLAARIVPPDSAGTIFALLMALGNLGTSAATVAGGVLHEAGLEQLHLSSTNAFNLLVGIGALFTAGCWLLTPVLGRLIDQAASATAPTPTTDN